MPFTDSMMDEQAASDLSLAACSVTKHYGALVANDAIDFELRRGEVHGLLGENGAGKTTLMRLAFGMEWPDSGHFEVDGEPVEMNEPATAMAHGIGMVHQHFMIVPTLTVAENVVLGNEPVGFSTRVRRGDMEQMVSRLGQKYGLRVEPGTLVADLTVGEQQRVEILRTLYRGARILILDEPTAVLTPQETAQLFGVVRDLAADGVSVVIITHKIPEVMSIADRISVLRHGRRIGTVAKSATSEAELVGMMVGKTVELHKVKASAAAGAPQLEVDDLFVDDQVGQRRVAGVSLTVGAGEIVGVAGVDGNGQAELVGAISGMMAPASGEIRVQGVRLSGGVPDAIDRGIGYIAEDRHRRGLFLAFSLAENLSLRRYRERPMSRWGLLSPRAMVDFAEPLIEAYDVRGGRALTPAASLSGGNQQKLVIARELEADPTVLIAAQPTRGLDIGAIDFVHSKLLEAQDAGKAILLVSFELEELRALADRVLVMYEGRIVKELPPGASDEDFGLAMSGTGAVTK